ncbi:MAG: cobalamin B12-binding domain-containing protein [Candidatus Helarchaeota archaeon]
MSHKRIRFLMAKMGQDGDDRRAKAICLGLRDSGLEVVYIGLETPKQIVEAALQEDADVVGISVTSEKELSLIPEVITIAKDYGLNETIFILAGGMDVSTTDNKKLKDVGVKAIFESGIKLNKIVDFLYDYFPDRPHQ